MLNFCSNLEDLLKMKKKDKLKAINPNHNSQAIIALIALDSNF